MRLRVLALLAAVLALALVGAGCGEDDEGGGDGTTEGTAQQQDFETLEPGVLTVGSDIPFSPFEFGDAPNYKGFDIDIINEVADRMGLEVQIEKTPFATIFRNLAQGQFDAVISATTITPEREEVVDFSDPYFLANQSLVVSPGSDIQSVEDLSGATVGVQIGTTGAEYAQNETDAGEVRTFDIADQAFQALNAGQVDAVIIDFPVAQEARQAGEEFEIAEQIDTGEEYGIAVQPDADPLLQAINDALSNMKEDGTYAEIYRKWFDEDPPPQIVDPSGGAEDGGETEPGADAGPDE